MMTSMRDCTVVLLRGYGLTAIGDSLAYELARLDGGRCAHAGRLGNFLL